MRKFLITVLIAVFSFSAFSFGNENESYRKQIVNLVNAQRQKAGLPKLTEDKKLNKLSDKKVQLMAEEGKLSHTAGGYSSLGEFVRDYGFKYWTVGENIARNWRTPEEVMKAWMESAGHRANILNEKFTHIGVAKTTAPNGDIYWVQIFLKYRD